MSSHAALMSSHTAVMSSHTTLMSSYTEITLFSLENYSIYEFQKFQWAKFRWKSPRIFINAVSEGSLTESSPVRLQAILNKLPKHKIAASCSILLYFAIFRNANRSINWDWNTRTSLARQATRSNMSHFVPCVEVATRGLVLRATRR